MPGFFILENTNDQKRVGRSRYYYSVMRVALPCHCGRFPICEIFFSVVRFTGAGETRAVPARQATVEEGDKWRVSQTALIQ